MPKGCFVMHCLSDIANVHSNMGLENKVMIFGGWKPYQNLSEIQVFDIKERRVCNTGKFAKGLQNTCIRHESGQISASTSNESGTSSGEEMYQINQINSNKEGKLNISVKYGDKFTKKPIEYGKYLILLGRTHIHLFDLETFSSKVLLKMGEDRAENLGNLLKINPESFIDRY